MKKTNSKKMEVEGVIYSLLLRVHDAAPSSELNIYKETLSNAAKGKGQKYFWLQAGTVLEFWVALEKDN